MMRTKGKHSIATTGDMEWTWLHYATFPVIMLFDEEPVLYVWQDNRVGDEDHKLLHRNLLMVGKSLA